MRSIFLLALLLGASTALAKPADLPAGLYQLVCASDDGSSADPDLSVRHVEVVVRDAKLSIIVDGATVVIRRDDIEGVLFTLPISEGQKGAAVAQVVYVGSAVWTPENAPARIQGVYRILWPKGEQKGRFALIGALERKR
jgi:hypothetical protein